MPQTSLTDTQLVILSAASQRDDLAVELPERLRGGVAKSVLATLLAKALIEPVPDPDGYNDRPDAGFAPVAYRVSEGGLAALGIESDEEREAALPAAVLADGDAQRGSAGKEQANGASATSALPRAGTKLAEVIALLERGNGASIDELTAATGWLAYTTRAALTGLRKRGHVVPKAKREDGTTVYRIAAADAGANKGEAT